MQRPSNQRVAVWMVACVALSGAMSACDYALDPDALLFECAASPAGDCTEGFFCLEWRDSTRADAQGRTVCQPCRATATWDASSNRNAACGEISYTPLQLRYPCDTTGVEWGKRIVALGTERARLGRSSMVVEDAERRSLGANVGAAAASQHGVLPAGSEVWITVLGTPNSEVEPAFMPYTARLRLPVRGGTGAFTGPDVDDAGAAIGDRTFGEGLKGPLAAGDFDGDGVQDVVAAVTAGPVWVWRGIGAGHLESLTRLGSETTNAHQLLAGDFDHDRDLDLLVMAAGPTLWTNDGTGHFVRARNEPGEGGEQSAAIGDADSNGTWDIAFAGQEAGVAFLSVWLSRDDGTFVRQTRAFPGTAVSDIDLGDIDGDGDADLAVAGATGLQIWTNQGNGELLRRDGGIDMGRSSGFVGLVDLDQDGWLDLTFQDRAMTQVRLNLAGKGQFMLGNRMASNTEPALGDIDGDGDLDALVVAREPSWLINQGAGLMLDALPPNAPYDPELRLDLAREAERSALGPDMTGIYQVDVALQARPVTSPDTMLDGSMTLLARVDQSGTLVEGATIGLELWFASDADSKVRFDVPVALQENGAFGGTIAGLGVSASAHGLPLGDLEVDVVLSGRARSADCMTGDVELRVQTPVGAVVGDSIRGAFTATRQGAVSCTSQALPDSLELHPCPDGLHVRVGATAMCVREQPDVTGSVLTDLDGDGDLDALIVAAERGQVWLNQPVFRVIEGTVSATPDGLGQLRITTSRDIGSLSVDDVAVWGIGGRYAVTEATLDGRNQATLRWAPSVLPSPTERLLITVGPTVTSRRGIALQPWVWRGFVRMDAGPRAVTFDEANSHRLAAVDKLTALGPVDLDGDGALDIVGAVDGDIGQLVWWSDAGSEATTGPTGALPLTGPAPTWLMPVDILGDPVTDLVAPSSGPLLLVQTGLDPAQSPPRLETRAFCKPTSTDPRQCGEWITVRDVRHLAWGDLDGDGQADLVTVDETGIKAWYGAQVNDPVSGATRRALVQGEQIDNQGGAVAVVEDFDQDGRLDILSWQKLGMSSVWWNSGEETERFVNCNQAVFLSQEGAAPTFNQGGGGAPVVGEIDGDGRYDLIVPPDVTTRGVEDSVFGFLDTPPLLERMPQFIVDLDGDGLLDAVLVGERQAEWLRGVGDGFRSGSWKPLVSFSGDVNAPLSAFGDIDQDGRLDLIVQVTNETPQQGSVCARCLRIYFQR